MSQDEVEQIPPGWQAASQAVAQEPAEWRRAHPKATLAEIEDAVFEAMQKLQARALGQVVHASAVTHVAAPAPAEGPRRPTGGCQMGTPSRQRRRVRHPQERAHPDFER